MAASAKSVANAKARKIWATMDGTEKMVFVAKVFLMVCSFGFVYGGALVEGMTYESY